ncbi:hypothetical protein JCM5353_008927 [Sporobolomyces roseus]
MTPVDRKEDVSTSTQTTATLMENSMETVGYHVIARKIDRLSLLPNELLDHIFDLAYSIDTPSTGPLSKHLLPFHITGIYRRISLSNGDNITKLVRKINKSPSLARLVKSLQIDCEEDLDGALEVPEATEFQQFFRQLVHLEWLDLGENHYELFAELKATRSPASTSPLHHITSAISSRTPQPLLGFTSFPALCSLHVTAYHHEYGAFDTSGCSSLPLLTHLTVSGTFADDRSIASFCALCPSLTHLSLYAFKAAYVDLLQALPVTLSRLELGTIDGDGNIGGGTGAEDCSLELSKFILLQHLSVGNRIFSWELPTHLSNLQHLETIRLVGDEIFYVEMMELLTAPTRPPSLRTLELRLDCIETGSRLEVDERGRVVGVGEPEEHDWQVSGDWNLPKYVRVGETYGYEEMCGVRKIAAQSGVEIRGSLYEALEMVDVYFLELANIAIYRCFRCSTLEPYIKLQDRGLGSRLPPLDLDSFDPKNLKLVKTDLPDEGWFALSLENGD